MGRLTKGSKPEPFRTRLKRYRSDLARRGGRRLSVELDPDANQALEVVQTFPEHTTIKSAIAAALIHYASCGPKPGKT